MAVTATLRVGTEDATRATYEGDGYTWALEQAALLESGRVADADLVNIAEELRDLGKEQAHKLESAYRLVLLHMLKWDHQPERRSRSWAVSIAIHRQRAARTLRDNPGLRSRRADILADAYEDARLEASGETGLHPRAFPEDCPYDLDVVMTRDHPLPEAP